jgi:hypothetical protein
MALPDTDFFKRICAENERTCHSSRATACTDSLEDPNNSYLDSSVKKRHVDFSPSQKFPIPIPQQATTSVEVMRSDCTRIFGLLSGVNSGP